jgi:hypothetical protein
MSANANPIEGDHRMTLGDADGPDRITLAVSDQSQLASLRNWLRDQADGEVAVTPGIPGPGELGALDVLTVLAGSSGVVAAVKTLPEFIRSRRVGFRIETTIGGRPFTLDADNADELMPVLERLLNERD